MIFVIEQRLGSGWGTITNHHNLFAVITSAPTSRCCAGMALTRRQEPGGEAVSCSCKPIPNGVCEECFTGQVIDLAHLRGWKVAHFRVAYSEKGWRTAVQGDAGFPDLILAREGHIIIAELKAEKGKLSEEQQAWFDALWGDRIHGEWFEELCYTVCWRPSDWTSIEEVLR